MARRLSGLKNTISVFLWPPTSSRRIRTFHINADKQRTSEQQSHDAYLHLQHITITSIVWVKYRAHKMAIQIDPLSLMAAKPLLFTPTLSMSMLSGRLSWPSCWEMPLHYTISFKRDFNGRAHYGRSVPQLWSMKASVLGLWPRKPWIVHILNPEYGVGDVGQVVAEKTRSS